jgi:hypothetical protein
LKEQHTFLLAEKKWLGEGTIKLSGSDEELHFYTRWNLGKLDKGGKIPAFQEVQIRGVEEAMHNQFVITDLTPTHFSIELENAALGKISGKGIIKNNLIAWEFRNKEIGFEGFEFYEKQEDGSYLMRAEYATPDHFRTMIRAKIWEKLE